MATAVEMPAAQPAGRASAFFLTVLGLLIAGIGVYYLLDPTVDNAAAAIAGASAGIDVPMRVVNIQRLTMGETFTIVGAIFLAAAWRPFAERGRKRGKPRAR